MSGGSPIKCEEALKLLALFLDGELQSDQSASVEQHLELCRSCYSQVEFERRLKQQLAALGRQQISTQLENRIRALLS